MHNMFREGPRLFSVSGWKHTGKTSLLCSLIPRLGGRIIVCKIFHAQLTDNPSADSSRFLEAGAAYVHMVSKEAKDSFTGTKGYIDSLALPGYDADAAFILYEGVLVKQSLTAIMYSVDSLDQGIKPGHISARLLIHDGNERTIAYLKEHKSPVQILCHRNDIHNITDLTAGGRI